MSGGIFDDKAQTHDSLLTTRDGNNAVPKPSMVGQSRNCNKKRSSRIIRLVAISLVGLVGTTYLRGSTFSSSSEGLFLDGNPEAVWDSITPSDKLEWVPCYENKECTRFTVPMDYDSPHGLQVAVALVKRPSKFSTSDKNYRGPILFNPGGPGGSGVDLVRYAGELFSRLLGDDYDIIGFDPRGVGRTTPKVSAFADQAEAATFDFIHTYDPVINTTSDALSRAHARWDILGSLARERSGFAAQYVSTALVSHDMLTITRAHGYEKLKFWGFSYGSVLGITYAAMFPDKVERLIVDGVCDTYDYYETQWSNNLRDTNAGLREFFESCVAAGPDGCALYESSADKIAARLEKLYASLKEQPLAVSVPRNATGVTSLDYGMVDYKIVRLVILKFLYSPYSPGPSGAASLAAALASAEKGDGHPVWEIVKNFQTEFDCKCGDASVTRPTSNREQFLAIACSDGDVVDDSVEELYEHYERMAKDSSFAELWDIRIECSGWKVRAKKRFNGPFVGNTSHPILLIGNTADPVTPLWNANKMAKGFQDAVVLTQNSSGHASLAASSVCTAKAIREYFREGSTPVPGTVCQVEDRMFAPPNSVHADLMGEDRELLEVIRELRDNFEVPTIHI